MKLGDFQQLINDNPWLKVIELSNYGEIFLNPDLLAMMEYAHRRNVALRAENGVNLNNVKEDVLEGLVKYKFESVTCSIDGGSDETYKVYRIKGNFDTVIGNIKRINFYKKKYQSELPELNWQYVVFGHNEHEISAARKLAEELNMKFYVKLSWDDDFSPVRDQEAVRKETGAASRKEFRQRKGVEYMQGICHQLWDQPQINWDGKVLGCCRNFWGDFGGNAFRDGLLKSINSEKMNYTRDMLQGKEVERSDIPCTACSIYQHMKADSKWLKRPTLLTRFREVIFGLRQRIFSMP